MATGAESRRLEEDTRREKNWKRWGPYLSERQWGTVREPGGGGQPPDGMDGAGRALHGRRGPGPLEAIIRPPEGTP